MKKLFQFLFIFGIFCFFVIYSYAQEINLSRDVYLEIKKNLDIVKTNPNSPEAYFELAMSYAYNGLVEQGLICLQRVDKLDNKYAKKVIQKYELLANKEPQNWKHWFKLAFGYYFDNKENKAKDCFERILKQDPNNVPAMGYLALVLGNDVVIQEEQLKKKNLDPEKIKEILNPKIDEVIELCKKGISIEPDQAAGLHLLLAQAYLKKGDLVGVASETLITLRYKTEIDKYLKQKNLMPPAQ